MVGLSQCPVAQSFDGLADQMENQTEIQSLKQTILSATVSYLEELDKIGLSLARQTKSDGFIGFFVPKYIGLILEYRF